MSRHDASPVLAARRIEFVDTGEWVDVARRLYAASPKRYREILETMRDMVEACETIAEAELNTVFRPSDWTPGDPRIVN